MIEHALDASGLIFVRLKVFLTLPRSEGLVGYRRPQGAPKGSPGSMSLVRYPPLSAAVAKSRVRPEAVDGS